jgi:superfamily II DNA or RNA helicase
VFEGLSEQPVRLLRAPPGSGKTALGQLLVAAAPPEHKVVVVNINSLAVSGVTLEAFWAKTADDTMARALDPLEGPRRTYIVDEVQMLYALGPDAPFWRAVSGT